MKKSCILLLTMLFCVIGLSACGTSKEETESGFMTREEAVTAGEDICNSLDQIVQSGMAFQYAQDPIISAGLDSWSAALNEIGNYSGVVPDKTEVVMGADEITIKAKIKGDKSYPNGDARTATQEIIIGKESIISMSTTVDYSLGELMEKAALNTLLGMGTVFAVLILISLIISLFSFIPKIQSATRKKEKKSETVTSAPVVEQIAQREELAQEDDTELVAVIAAAIAMSEGKTSTDGLAVRSIIRR